jgi:methylthioribose-1-phosphate isomerase
MKLLDPVCWKDDALVILDQTLLPVEEKYLRLTTVEEVWEAIRVLRVRGAPAIGVAAAFGLYLALRNIPGTENWTNFRDAARKHGAYLDSARPTAVNLRWAVDRILKLIESQWDRDVASIQQRILVEAQSMVKEDMDVCQAIGQHGLSLLRDGATVLTHCNAGGLATTRYGTALAPVYAAVEKGLKVAVYADETRPLLQGARLTAFELHQAGVPVTVICDNMAATVMSQKKIDLVIVGADRVVANGDFANKIGTFGVAILAHEHGIPFYCAAPLSSIDINLPSGDKIPIEERSAEEVTNGFGKRTAPKDVQVFNPAFDVTPNRYVTAFITEKGVIQPPFEENLKKLFKP